MHPYDLRLRFDLFRVFQQGPPLKLDGFSISDPLVNSSLNKDTVKNKGSEANAWPFYSIFNRMSPNEFHQIATRKCAKEA